MRTEWPAAALGHGIGLRTAHFAELLAAGPSRVGFFEVISENFFEPGGRPWAVLDRVRRDLPVVLHGVSMGVGNASPVSREYLRRLRVLIDRVEPVWVSDHLCWGAYGGHHVHDLLPLPYTEEAVKHVAAQLIEVQELLGRRILLENVSSYVSYRASELSEAEFVCAVAEQADCGLLIDINNVYVSSHNHGFSAEAYLDQIPIERVGQFHLAGHTDYGDYLLDSHIGPIGAPVWALYRRAVERFGPVPTLVEWDEAIPSFSEVCDEAERAKRIEAEVLAGKVA